MPRANAVEGGARPVLYAGRPQSDPIVTHGPFTGDSKEDTVRLYTDYRSCLGGVVTKMLDRSEAIARGEAPPPPIARLIGFELVSVKPGEARVEFQATDAHANPMGTLHGGVLCDIADATMGIAYSSNLDEGESFTTLELKINFLKPIWKARLLAVGRLIKQGRTVGLVECDITDEKGSLVARATSTCMTLRGGQAQGR